MELPEINEEFEEIEIDSTGKILPEKHDKKIIIDADTIAFAACVMCQYEVDVIEEYYSDEELKTIKSHYTWNEAESTYIDIDIEEALAHAKEKIKLILENIGGKEENTELHFTMGKISFRYNLLEKAFPDDPEMWYKAKRKNKITPVGIKEIKIRLAEEYNGVMHYEVEADDAVVMRKKQLGDKAILCAVDKDVLKNTVGRHWNYYDRPDLNIRMKWVEINEDEAIYNQYLQAITGDKSDNVPGLPGIGKKKAEKFIELGMSESELWQGVLAAFNSHCNYGDPEEMAILNMRLVSMHQLDDNLEIKLWTPQE